MSRSPYLSFTRSAWSKVGPGGGGPPAAGPLHPDLLAGLGGAEGPPESGEVSEVYGPLAHLIALRAGAAHRQRREVDAFLGHRSRRRPFIVGIAGSVAVGKSTLARVLEALLGSSHHLVVTTVATDGFLFPNRVLEDRGLMDKKGFPESYDQRHLVAFLEELVTGAKEAWAPVYSHHSYDVVEGARQPVEGADVVLLEGLNVLQAVPATGERPRLVSDYFDLSLYLHAEEPDLESWFVDRVLTLRRGAFTDPDSFFHRFASLPEEEVRAAAASVWAGINRVNLLQNILPTRWRADIVLEKAVDHSVRTVLVRP